MNASDMYDETDLAKMFLPIGEMLQVHTIADITEENITGERRLSELDLIFPLHFPGDPIFPGSLLIEGAGQIIAIWGWHNGLRGKPRLVKVTAEFKSPVYAHDKKVTYSGTMTKRNNIVMGNVNISVDERYVGKVVATIVVLETCKS